MENLCKVYVGSKVDTDPYGIFSTFDSLEMYTHFRLEFVDVYGGWKCLATMYQFEGAQQLVEF